MTYMLAIISVPLTVLTYALASELFLGLRPLNINFVASAENIRATIVIPAHNEEAVLEHTLNLVGAAASGFARILVVADNCSDATASIARRSHVDVIERFNAALRGKGFALDFARCHLSEDPPDVVLVLDADCTTDRRSLERLVGSCATSGKPCQAVYLQSPARNASPVVQLSTFAFFVRNVVRQRGLFRLTRRVHLLGSGMAIPWNLFDAANLATSSIVEDLELGLELARRGHAAIFIEDAVVMSEPAAEKETIEQRRRWEGGSITAGAKWVPSSLARSMWTANVRGFFAVIDLLIPPLALLLLLDSAALLISVLASTFGHADWSLSIFLASSIVFTSAALAGSWLSGGKRFVSLAVLARVPFYVLWKVPIYLGIALRGAPKEWVRTRRH